MKLGLSLGYASPQQDSTELIAHAHRIGIESLWTAEAYGLDAFTPLAWHAARTPGMRLGTQIVQMSARTPTATAMAAMTLDQLSGGRMVLGLGVSGPQVVEGWYGQTYERPLARTREYIDILRRVMRRDVVVATGEYYPIPRPGGTGLAKPLRSTLHPIRERIPILLAAEGPKNVALAAEVADGWIPLFFSPHDDKGYRESLCEGFLRRGIESPPDEFEVACPVAVELGPIEEAANRVRPLLALYIGGMGARTANFHYEVFARMGFEAQCARIQKAYLSGDKGRAIAAVTTEMVERVALVGPPEKVAEELEIWKQSLVTTMLVWGSAETLTYLAEQLL